MGEREYRVWFGTNRRPNNPSNPNEGYSAERDNKVHYGECRVYVPASHKVGSTGSGWLKRLIMRTDDRLKITGTRTYDSESFWQRVSGAILKAPANKRHAVVLIHGYRVSFEDAALRAAQIGFDLSVQGAMAFYSWPSQGTLEGYLVDAAAVEASEEHIADFLTGFARRSGADAVHIFAHSMGNRGVLRAVNRIAQEAEKRSGIKFGQIILAAADVDADTFRNLYAAYEKIGERTTLYVSERDRAVEAAEWLHGAPRVGLMPPVWTGPGVDTVCATNVDLTMLGHSYIAEAREVLTDIHQLIASGLPPDERATLEANSTAAGERYWTIRA